MDDLSLFDVQYVNPALLNGMKFKITFDSGEILILTCGADDDEINGLLEFEFEEEVEAGSNPLTIRGGNTSTTYNVEITDNSGVESITVKKMPDKTEYAFYEDIDLTGLELEIAYSDGGSAVYQYSDDNEFWEFYSELFDGHYLKLYLDVDTENHTYIINISYAGSKTNFTLEVTKYVTDVKLIKLPDKVFTESFDIENLYDNLETEDDWNNLKIKREKNSISYNMAGAELMFTFNEGDSVVYVFNEDDRISEGEMGLNSCIYESYVHDDGSSYEFINVSDLGNFEAVIEYQDRFNFTSIEFTANIAIVEPAQTVLSDPKTGISVIGDFEDGTELVVTTAKTSLANVVAAYDITLVKDGKSIQPYGTITISVPYKQSGLAVYHIKSDGTTENMKAVYEDGTYVFSVDHLSTFALVDETKSGSTEGESKNDNKGTTDGSGNTGNTGTSNMDNSVIATGAGTTFTAVILLLAFGMGILIVYMKRRENS